MCKPAAYIFPFMPLKGHLKLKHQHKTMYISVSGHYEECCLWGCYAVWLLYEPIFFRNIASYKSHVVHTRRRHSSMYIGFSFFFKTSTTSIKNLHWMCYWPYTIHPWQISYSNSQNNWLQCWIIVLTCYLIELSTSKLYGVVNRMINE
jgi:hypothetical protein